MPAKEIRSIALEYRATGENGEMWIEGRPIVYDQEGNAGGGFKEIIKRGAASEALSTSHEVLLWQHEMTQPLASRDSGTLESREDGEGVVIRARLDKTEWGRNAYEAISNGMVQYMSFGFTILKDEWELRDGEVFRIVEKIKEIFDYSPVTIPAYLKTSIEARAKAEALVKSQASDDTGHSAEVWEDAFVSRIKRKNQRR